MDYSDFQELRKTMAKKTTKLDRFFTTVNFCRFGLKPKKNERTPGAYFIPKYVWIRAFMRYIRKIGKAYFYTKIRR
jgi:hypothetical protein